MTNAKNFIEKRSEEVLLNEDINTSSAKARFFGDITEAALKWGGKKLKEVGSDVLKGYPRTVAVYPTEYGSVKIDDAHIPFYTSVITGNAKIYETDDQEGLQYATDSNGFVYGAYVNGVKYVYSGLKENVKKAVAAHELTHELKPHAGEDETEVTAAANVHYIQENHPDPAVRNEAGKVLEGFTDFSVSSRYGGKTVYRWTSTIS